MKLNWFISISLAANILLAGLWVKNHAAGRSSADSQSVVRKLSSARDSKAKTTLSSQRPVTWAASPASADSVRDVVSPLSWKDIQTDDLKELVRRLRAFGCPEETVRDIILAEVNRRYAARTRELWPDRYKERLFWAVDKREPGEYRKNRERRRRDRELQKEKSALLVELLGVDPEKERRKQEGIDEPMNWEEQRVAFLPEAKREEVLDYLNGFEEKMQDFYESSRGFWDAESRAEQRRLEAERLAGLAQFLTPEEVREFELRQSQLATQLSWDLRGLSLTRDEYEAIFDIRKKYGDSIYNYGDIESALARQQVDANKKAMQGEIVAALGEVLGKEYERSQDYAYQQLARLSKKYDLPANTAARVYDIKDTVEQSVKQLRDDKSLTNEQRQEALQEIRVETERTVKESLGEKGYKNYLRQGGWWINNIAPRIVTPGT